MLIQRLVSLLACLAPAVAAQTLPVKLWYHSERSIDLTGDGVPELVTLTAFETSRPDSFIFVLSVISKDSAILTRSWEDVYGRFGTAQQVSRTQWRDGLREDLDSTLAPRVFVPIKKYPAGPAHPLWTGEDCLGEDDARECIAFEMKEASLLARWKREGRSPAGSGRAGDSTTYQWFRELKTEPFDTSQVMAVWEDIRAHTPVVFELNTGYESHEELAWSNLKHRFYHLRTCC